MSYTCTVTWPNGANVRPMPSTANASLVTFDTSSVFEASALVPDQDAPTDATKQWAQIGSGAYAGRFVAVKYPPGPRCTVVDNSVTPPPPPPSSEPVPVSIKLSAAVTDSAGHLTNYQTDEVPFHPV